MENTTIFYYTNNLVSPLILRESLKNAIYLADENNCELIITSHFPLLKNYINSPLASGELYKNDFDINKNQYYPSDIYKYIVKDLEIESKHRNFVVGKLPYSYESIFQQILLSLEHASHENIVLMEHDCLYPNEYINAVKKCLNYYGKEFGYCSFATCFLNENGFFDISLRKFLLSSCFGKKDLFKKIFSKKIELLREGKIYKFEPLLDSERNYEKQYPNDIVIKNHLCIDKWLDGPILDIRHQLNSSPNILVQEGDYLQKNEYWGNADKYINMIQSIDVKPEKQILWGHGTARQNY